MGQRIFFFILTNILVIAMITIVTQLFGLEPYLTERGINYQALLIFCALWGFGGAFISLWISKWMAKKMMGVKIIDPDTNDSQARWLLDRVYEYAKKAEIEKMPEVGVYNSPEINAFATGPTRNKSLVAVSTGLMQSMERNQIEGVLAHEVGHIANGDMVTMTLIQGVVNAFVMFFARVIAFAVTSNMRGGSRFMAQFAIIIALQILFGILGSMVTAYFSRRREFRADEASAYLGSKEKMIAALRGLEANMNQGRKKIGQKNQAEEAFATLKISGSRKGFMALLSTHPDIGDRIQAVEALEV